MQEVLLQPVALHLKLPLCPFESTAFISQLGIDCFYHAASLPSAAPQLTGQYSPCTTVRLPSCRILTRRGWSSSNRWLGVS